MRSLNLIACTALAAMACGLSGCATATKTMLSDSSIASTTASAIGVASSDITISDRKADTFGINTRYVATTKAGVRYYCTLNGGGVLAAGIVNGASCSKQNS